MTEPDAAKQAHRQLERYGCPSFFYARLSDGGAVDENARVEDVSMKGLRVTTSCDFQPGTAVEVELKTEYVGPVKLYARVKWCGPSECEGPPLRLGLSIQKVRILDMFKFMKLISQIKRELW
ncbi:MAG: hypothetical protein Kow0099_35070 [Candidatus Abyssubacteria bacterium]